MLNKQELIEKLNFHFPSYEAVDGINAGENYKDGILFIGENAHANFITDHDDDDNYVCGYHILKDCPVYLFLDRHGWDVIAFCEQTVLAIKCPIKEEQAKTFYEWDRLIEKSKTEKLTEDEKNIFRELQKKLLRMP